MPTTTTNYGLYKCLVNDPTDQDLWGGYLNTNFDTLDTQLKAVSDAVAAVITVPLGGGLDYFGTSAPTKFLFAYGQAISRTTYSSLFAIFGTTYGSGDGSTTFNMPDKRGRSSFGKDNMGGSAANRLTGSTAQGISGSTLGATGGEQAHTQTLAELVGHTHTYRDFAANGAFGISGGTGQDGQTTANTGSSGSGAAFNVLPPGIVCNYIIRVL